MDRAEVQANPWVSLRPTTEGEGWVRTWQDVKTVMNCLFSFTWIVRKSNAVDTVCKCSFPKTCMHSFREELFVTFVAQSKVDNTCSCNVLFVGVCLWRDSSAETLNSLA